MEWCILKEDCSFALISAARLWAHFDSVQLARTPVVADWFRCAHSGGRGWRARRSPCRGSCRTGMACVAGRPHTAPSSVNIVNQVTDGNAVY